MKCFLVNARSILRQIDHLRVRVKDENPDVIGITETWLHEDILDREIQIPDYNIIRRDRKDGRKGGGVLLMVKHGITVEELDSSNEVESVWCKIGKQTNNIHLGLCYRPPNSITEYSNSLLGEIQHFTTKKSVVMGDFNYPDIDWETYSGTKVSEDFRNLVLDKFLNQHVDHATRGDNILDLILSTNESLVSDVTVNAPLGSGDHCLITFAIPLSNNLTANSCKMPNFYRADFSKMKENLISVPWTEILAPLNATDS